MMNHGPEGLTRDPEVRHGAHPEYRVGWPDAPLSRLFPGSKTRPFFFFFLFSMLPVVFLVFSRKLIILAPAIPSPRLSGGTNALRFLFFRPSFPVYPRFKRPRLPGAANQSDSSSDHCERSSHVWWFGYYGVHT